MKTKKNDTTPTKSDLDVTSLAAFNGTLAHLLSEREKIDNDIRKAIAGWATDAVGVPNDIRKTIENWAARGEGVPTTKKGAQIQSHAAAKKTVEAPATGRGRPKTPKAEDSTSQAIATGRGRPKTPKAEDSTSQAIAVEMLSTNETVRPLDLAAKAGIGNGYASAVLVKLVKDKIAQKNGRGTYSLLQG